MTSMTTWEPAAESASAETDSAELSSRLNWLRAGVLGANDGIVSIAATVVGVAAATSEVRPVFLAGIAAVIAGMLSMALGEYVSVSSAADSQRNIISRIKGVLTAQPAESVVALRDAYIEKGLSTETAELVAMELTAHDAISAHLSTRYHMDEDEVVNPMAAALASGVSFLVGALLPLLTILLVPLSWRIPVTIVSAVVALALTGGLGARLGDAPVGRAVLRVVVGGIAALLVTWFIGNLIGGAAVA